MSDAPTDPTDATDHIDSSDAPDQHPLAVPAAQALPWLVWGARLGTVVAIALLLLLAGGLGAGGNPRVLLALAAAELMIYVGGMWPVRAAQERMRLLQAVGWALLLLLLLLAPLVAGILYFLPYLHIDL